MKILTSTQCDDAERCINLEDLTFQSTILAEIETEENGSEEPISKNRNSAWTARTIALKSLNCGKFVFILSKELFVTSLVALFSNINLRMGSHTTIMLREQQKNDQNPLPFHELSSKNAY